jgi:hypothetical protein
LGADYIMKNVKSKSEALKREHALKKDRKFRNYIKLEYSNAQP